MVVDRRRVFSVAMRHSIDLASIDQKLFSGNVVPMDRGKELTPTDERPAGGLTFMPITAVGQAMTMLVKGKPVQEEIQAKNESKALSVPGDMDNHLERMRLRIEIILARDRNLKHQHPSRIQKPKPAVPPHLVRSTLAGRAPSPEMLKSSSLEVSKVFGPAMSTLDISESSMEAIYHEFLKSDPSYRVPLSTSLIGKIKKMTNQQAMLYLLMHVITAEEKAARDKIEVIEKAVARDQRVEKIEREVKIEVATLNCKVKELKERLKEKERSVQVAKIDSERLHGALTLAVVTHKEEMEKAAKVREGLEKSVESLRQELDDLKSRMKAELVDTKAEKDNGDQVSDNGNKSDVGRTVQKDRARPKIPDNLKQFINKPPVAEDQADQTNSNSLEVVETILVSPAKKSFKEKTDEISPSAAQIEPEQVVVNHPNNDELSQTALDKTIAWDNRAAVESQNRISILEQQLAIKSTEVDRLSQLHDLKVKQLDMKHSMHIAKLRDDNILLKKQILWLKEKLASIATKDLPTIAEEPSDSQKEDESSLMLSKLKAGLKSIDDTKRQSHEDDLNRAGVMSEEIDHLKLKVSELQSALDYYQRSESQRLSAVKMEAQKTIDQLTCDLMSAREECRQESSHRQALERLVSSVASNARDDAGMDESADPPTDRQPSYFTTLVDIISKQRDSSMGMTRLNKMAASQLNKGHR